MDDLLDLNFGPAATVKRQGLTPAPVSSVASRTASPFSATSSAGRPIYSSSATPSRTATPLVRPSSVAPKQDAFESLFASSTAGSPSADGLTLVERQRKMDRERAERQQRERDAFDFDSWHAGSSSSVAQPPLGAVQPTPSFNPVSSAGSRTVSRPTWDFDGLLAPVPAPLASKPSTPVPVSSTHTTDPWNMAIFDSALPTTGDVKGSNGFEEGAHGDEDVLGLLSEPVRERAQEARPATRPASPPPHIIGQIVEMGFAPTQARQALARTDTGLDVQAALEMLLAESNGTKAQMDDGDRLQDEARLERERERRRRRRQGPSRAEPSLDRREPDAAAEIPFVDQADKILAQASAVGMSVFSKANSLWNVGKERAQKIYEERAAAAAAAAGGERVVRDGKGKAVDGRPRWMVDAEAANAADERGLGNGRQHTRSGADRFVDSDEDEPPVRSSPPRAPSAPLAQAPRSKQVDLLGGASTEPTDRVYRSPARRKAAGAVATVKLSSAPTSGRSTPIPTPAPLKRRQYTRATPSQISTSSAFKESGNSHFKLGAYGDALEAYTRALDALPSDHVLRVPLYTNRAAAYLKQGEHAGAIEDCTRAISLVGLAYHPAKEAPLDDDEAARDVKLADGLVKALCKRASAYEMGEKWKLAKEDWQAAMSVAAAGVVFAAAGGANLRKMAGEGLARAGKMCEVLETGNDAKATSATARPTSHTARPVKSKPPPPPNPADSAGVAAMRAAASAAESEETLRLHLKDSVDKRVMAWSKGKETNLRGLLASLDLVLNRDEALWKDVKRPGMAELITDKQLKIGYMKVIGRLHPDKLNAGNSSVEQRMIANSVFGTLNEA